LSCKTGIKFISFLFILGSCTTAEHNFSAEELKVIDSLYNVRKDSVEAMMKAECDSIYLQVFDGIVDSIKEVRRMEIYEIIEE
jgi:hypothetical protein